MSLPLVACPGGQLTLPARSDLLLDRRDGGHLTVLPPREVWERSELTARELTDWSFLVAAAGRAMIEALPQLAGGCVNYWEAGNWAVHDRAEPAGPKAAAAHRRVHLHLLGRSPTASDPDWRWGEAPRFPRFARRHDRATSYERLTPMECEAVVSRAQLLLVDNYGVAPDAMPPRWPCRGCGYPHHRRADGGGALPRVRLRLTGYARRGARAYSRARRSAAATTSSAFGRKSCSSGGE